MLPNFPFIIFSILLLFLFLVCQYCKMCFNFHENIFQLLSLLLSWSYTYIKLIHIYWKQYIYFSVQSHLIQLTVSATQLVGRFVFIIFMVYLFYSLVQLKKDQCSTLWAWRRTAKEIWNGLSRSGKAERTKLWSYWKIPEYLEKLSCKIWKYRDGRKAVWN